MSPRLLLLAAALATQTQALESGQPEIRLESDCTALLTLRLTAEAGTEGQQWGVEIASPPTYRKLGQTYLSWAGSAQLERIRQDDEDQIRIRSMEPLPDHSSDLVLAIGKNHEPPTFYTLTLPPCDPAGTMREVVWGDTLFEIALAHARSLEVDAHTLMLAIQLYNRDAFIHDNINLVRAGARLYIPSQAEVARLNLSRQWLIDEVQFQNEQWRQWRREGTKLRTSPTLQERRLQLVPLKRQTESAVSEPVEPETAVTQTAATEHAEPDRTPPAEPEPEEAETPPVAVEIEDEKLAQPEEAGTPPEAVEIESEELTQLADTAPDKPGRGEPASRLPPPGVFAAAGILLLVYLFGLIMRRTRHARIIRQSVGDIEDPAQRATSALNLAHAHVEADRYDPARPLIRLVLAEGTEQERKEAKELKRWISSS